MSSASSRASCARTPTPGAARVRYEDSDALWGLARGLKIRLQTYRRGTDQAFDYYCGLYRFVPRGDAGDHGELRTVVRAAQRRLPWRGEDGTFVVLAHEERREINRLCDERQRRFDSVRISSLAPEPDFWCHRA